MAFWMAVALLAPSHFAKPVDYLCLDNSRFTLTASPTLAVVRFPDRDYVLRRRHSALAVRYYSKEATLYLDGDFAAFVADDRPLPGCHRVKDGDP